MTLKSSEIAVHHLEQIQEWLRANDIDPNDVPLWCVPTITEKEIAYRVYARNEQGNRYLDGDEPALTPMVVPLKRRPPAELDQWLAAEEG